MGARMSAKRLEVLLSALDLASDEWESEYQREVDYGIGPATARRISSELDTLAEAREIIVARYSRKGTS